MTLETGLAKSLEYAEAQYLCERVAGLAGIPENPYGASVIENAHYCGFFVSKNQSPMNNRICGFDLAKDPLPANEIAQFAKAGVPVHIPVIGEPKDVRDSAMRIGAAPLRGWTHGQFAAKTKDLPGHEAAGHTRQLGVSEIQTFVEIHSTGFRSSGSAKDMKMDMFGRLLASGNAEAYAVDASGVPVAIGLVYFASNQVAYLATAATTRDARKKGAHSALIARRIKAAREHDCTWVSSTALLNSASRRNLERAGLTQSHVQTLLAMS